MATGRKDESVSPLSAWFTNVTSQIVTTWESARGKSSWSTYLKWKRHVFLYVDIEETKARLGQAACERRTRILSHFHHHGTSV